MRKPRFGSGVSYQETDPRQISVHVSSMSQSSPNTHRMAESFPLIMPHSKSSCGPHLALPRRLRVSAAARLAPSHTESTICVALLLPALTHSSWETTLTFLCLIAHARFSCRVY